MTPETVRSRSSVIPSPGLAEPGQAPAGAGPAASTGTRIRSAFLLLALALASILASATAARAQDAADEAWRTGDMTSAERLYGERLARDSSDQRALHRVALLRAWAERYDESLALFDRLLRAAPANTEARIDRARVLAWKGDPAGAARALDQVLAADPANLAALQARAQFESWAGAYDEALATYQRIQAITPEDRALGYERARVLSWASRFSAAEAAYDSLLRANPGDRQALLGLAQVLAWSARLDSAEAVYQRVLASDPADVEALRGVARTAAWRGRLIVAERRWRAVLARHPSDAAALVGLSQTLRWQGRDAAALERARAAVHAAPTDRDARTELRWAELAVSPRVAPAFTYESDSDGNRIATGSSGAAWRPLPRVEVRGDGYLRSASLEGGGVPDGQARGAGLALWTQLEPGWAFLAGGGVSATDKEGAPARASWRAGVFTPGRNPVTASLLYARRSLDETALLILREVEVDEVAVGAQVSPGGGLVVSLAGSWAEYQGHVSGETNRRVGGNLALTRRFARYFTLGAAVRSFGFREDLMDGYFDPDFYGVVETIGRVNREWRRVSVDAEVAPGVQQVGKDGERTGSVRATGGVSYLIAPGRRIGVSGAYANAGLTSLSPTADAGYRYRAVTISGVWTF